jgi:hypothetical protein
MHCHIFKYYIRIMQDSHRSNKLIISDDGIPSLICCNMLQYERSTKRLKHQVSILYDFYQNKGIDTPPKLPSNSRIDVLSPSDLVRIQAVCEGEGNPFGGFTNVVGQTKIKPQERRMSDVMPKQPWRNESSSDLNFNIQAVCEDEGNPFGGFTSVVGQTENKPQDQRLSDAMPTPPWRKNSIVDGVSLWGGHYTPNDVTPPRLPKRRVSIDFDSTQADKFCTVEL